MKVSTTYRNDCRAGTGTASRNCQAATGTQWSSMNRNCTARMSQALRRLNGSQSLTELEHLRKRASDQG